MNYSDGFQDPKPFTPTIVVGIDARGRQEVEVHPGDAVAVRRQGLLAGAHAAQRAAGRSRSAPAYLLDIVKKRNIAVAEQYRDRLIALYGAERGKKIQYAEAFELNQYGRQALARRAEADVPRHSVVVLDVRHIGPLASIARSSPWRCCRTAVRGQARQDPAPRFRTGVDVVEVAVLARDSAGKPVTDLTRDEITVLEDGVPQPLVAFERVSLPARPAAVPPQRPAPVAQDVASNESSAPSRVFVLVLDSNHVAATRVRVVRDSARQFIENHVGPDDYVAVFSPGGIAAATQDFTTDKARLLAAVDQFTGMKMMSAIIEVDREQQAAEARRRRDARREGSERRRARKPGAGTERHARGAGGAPRADSRTAQVAAAVQRGGRLRHGGRVRPGPAECHRT